MARTRVHEDRILTSTERVERSRRHRGERRLEVLLDLTSYDQNAHFAQSWGCSRQEVMKMAWRACLPAMKRARSAEEVFAWVRSALEKAGIE